MLHQSDKDSQLGRYPLDFFILVQICRIKIFYFFFLAKLRRKSHTFNSQKRSF